MRESKLRERLSFETVAVMVRRLRGSNIRLTAIVLMGRVLSVALLAATFLAAARHLGPRSFGPVAAISGGTTLVLAFADAGLNSAAIRNLARDPSDTSDYIDIYAVKAVIAFSLGALWCTACLTVWRAFDAATLPYLPFAVFIVFRILADAAIVPAVAQRRMVLVASVTTIERASCLLVTLLLLVLGVGAWALPLGLATGASITLSLIRALPTIDVPRLAWPSMKSCHNLMRTSSYFWFISLSSQAQNLDTSIIGLVSGSRVAGLYGAPTRLVGPLSLAASTYAYVLYPQISAIRDFASARKAVKKGITALAALAVLVACCGLLVAPWVIETALGRAYKESAGPFRLVLLAACLNMLNAPVASVLQAQGREASVARIILIATCFGLSVSVLGSLLGGATGAALGVVASQSIAFFGLAWCWRRTRAEDSVHQWSSLPLVDQI